MLAEIGVLVPVRVEIVAVAVTVIIVGIVSEAVIYEYQSIRDEHPPKNNGKGKKKQNFRFAILSSFAYYCLNRAELTSLNMTF